MPPVEIRSQSYGKSQVRLSHIRREGPRHDFIELSCSIKLEGDFDAAYDAADNSLVVPTDTVKNTVYVLAKRHGVGSLESFSQLLARHFVETYPQVDIAFVTATESLWSRVELLGEPHPHAFVGGRDEHRRCEVTAFADEDEVAITQACGIAGLKVLKTTASAFTNYHVDEYTTLKPTDDRIFATTIDAEWRCLDDALAADANWGDVRRRAREELLRVFATQHSESVQHTLYDMGRAVLDACPEIDDLQIAMPNQHHLLANLEPFGLANANEVFVPAAEPFGDISATISRAEGESEA